MADVPISILRQAHAALKEALPYVREVWSGSEYLPDLVALNEVKAAIATIEWYWNNNPKLVSGE